MGSPRFDNSYARLPDGFYAPAPPAPAPDPELIRVNEALAQQLGLDAAWLGSRDGVAMLSGNRLPDGAEPIAMAYAGHQFGGWVPQLGDGRATLLGEVIALDGERYDLQLKGSGRTRFSRGGDGKAVLGPVLREYVVSEAMAAFGVPTTRALAAVTTGERVFRQGPEPGAVLTRVARSHVRVGTFQFFHGREDVESVRTLADYVIERHYPDAAGDHRKLFEAVLKRQAELVAHWMALGFIHGVMNTDNTQIVGETIDYGPCAFMDDFHPQKVFSSIDHHGRYAWGNQPAIATWNLARLAETLLPLLGKDEAEAVEWAQSTLQGFKDHFGPAFARRFRHKLGLASEADGHAELIEALFGALTEGDVDFTLFFRRLTQLAAGGDEAPVRALFSEPRLADAWLVRWRAQCDADASSESDRVQRMKKNNPIFIPRNHRVEEAIQAGNDGDFAPFHRLVDVLRRPFEEQPGQAELEDAPESHEVVRETFCGT
jgi:protein adenylyltransferase